MSSFLFDGCVTAVSLRLRGNPYLRYKKKALTNMSQPNFCTNRSNNQDDAYLSVILISSRSSDLRFARILYGRHSAFPVSQWPTFVNECNLGVYSGGSVRDSHPISYSPQKTKRSLGRLKHFVFFINITHKNTAVNGCSKKAKKRPTITITNPNFMLFLSND